MGDFISEHWGKTLSAAILSIIGGIAANSGESAPSATAIGVVVMPRDITPPPSIVPGSVPPHTDTIPVKTLPQVFLHELTTKIDNIDCNKSRYGFKAEIGFEKSNTGNLLKFIIKTKSNFEPAGYFLSDMYQKDCFLKTVNTFVQEVKNFKGVSLTASVDADFYGYADFMGNNKKFYSYKGEFGENLPIEVNLNSNDKSMVIIKNQKINNAELATLRAYSLFDSFKRLASNNLLDFSTNRVNFHAITANSSEEVGAPYRVAEMSLGINIHAADYKNNN